MQQNELYSIRLKLLTRAQKGFGSLAYRNARPLLRLDMRTCLMDSPFKSISQN